MAGIVICSKCGHENDAALTFCGSCGAFLEWSGEKAAAITAESSADADGDPPATGPAATAAPATGPSATAGAPEPASQPPLISPVRPGPSRRSVPATPLESDLPAATPSAAASPPAAAEPTIACPACGRANPLSRNFCHSCGTLLRPKPREPMARRRRPGAGPYRLLSILLLIAIILVGSFLLTRLTAGSGSARPTPSPTRASVSLLIGD